MANIHSFAADYSEGARQVFSRRTRRGPGDIVGGIWYDNPAKGPRGEALSTDVARLGPRRCLEGRGNDFSSTPRPGGLCGLGVPGRLAGKCWCGRSAKGSAAVFHPRDHPYGFAWTRRVTEEGQRPQPANYVDHSKTLSRERGLSRGLPISWCRAT